MRSSCGNLLRTIRAHDRGFHLLAGDFNTLAPGDAARRPQAAGAAARARLAERRTHPLAHDPDRPQRGLRRRLPPPASRRAGPELPGVGSARAARLRVRVRRPRRPDRRSAASSPIRRRISRRIISRCLRPSTAARGSRGIYNRLLPRTTRSSSERCRDRRHALIDSRGFTMTTTASPQPLTTETIGGDSPASAPILDAAFAGVRRVPEPINDPNRSYAPGTPERAELKARLKAMAAERIEIPLIIGGKEISTGRTAQAVMPHDHSHVLADYHLAGRDARAAGDRRRRGGAPRVGELALGRSRRGDPARGGAAGDDRGGRRSWRRRCSASRRRRSRRRSTPRRR